MSEVYTFIATKTTYDRAIPLGPATQAEFNRKLALAFQDISGGTLRVGQLRLMPRATPSPPFHLLCDGSEVSQEGFPELYDYLGDSEGAAAAGMFKLPNYIGALTAATTAPAQTVSGGTVSGGETVTTPSGSGQAGSTQGGNIPSGERIPIDIGSLF